MVIDMISGDHCNYPKPVQTYELVIEKPEDYMADYINYLNQPFLEEDYMADYLNMLNDYRVSPHKSDSSELRRRINTLRNTNIDDYDTDDSDEMRELRNRLNRLNEPQNVQRRLFDSDDYDPSYQPDEDLY